MLSTGDYISDETGVAHHVINAAEPTLGIILIGDDAISQHWNESQLDAEGWASIANELEAIAANLRKGRFTFDKLSKKGKAHVS